METAGVVAALPEDALAEVLRRLPARSLAAAACVCTAWRAVVDGRALLLPHRALLPRSVRGLVVNYIDTQRPYLFARRRSPAPAPATAPPKFYDLSPPLAPGELWPSDWSVLDHCNGLLLCEVASDADDLAVCNPATRRWAALPWRAHDRSYEGACLAFNPAASPHYEVLVIPERGKRKSPPERRPETEAERALRRRRELDAPFCLDWFFSSPEGVVMDVEVEEEPDDGGGPVEWPPAPWRLNVFSSRTNLWEDRIFVRDEEDETAAEMARDMKKRMKSWRLMPRWMATRYAVYRQGNLYVCCQAGFVARFSLSDDKYKVIQMPAYNKNAQPYLGKSQKGVCFGILLDCKLWVWILNESGGQMEWILNYKDDLKHYDRLGRLYGTSLHAPWTIEEKNTHVFGTNEIIKTQPTESFEWDSDSDDTLEAEVVNEESWLPDFKILGFHPYKDVIFLAESFTVVAYYLNNSKLQYLGYARPKYDRTLRVYGSLVYTPCMIGELDQDTPDQSLACYAQGWHLNTGDPGLLFG
ncbi:hypothetical protein ACP4OV_010251 [Aristida adscensionis]